MPAGDGPGLWHLGRCGPARRRRRRDISDLEGRINHPLAVHACRARRRMRKILLHSPPGLVRVTKSRELLGDNAKSRRVIFDPLLLSKLFQPRLRHRGGPGVLRGTRVTESISSALLLRLLHLLGNMGHFPPNPLLLSITAHLLLTCGVQIGPGREHWVFIKPEARVLRLTLRVDEGVDWHQPGSHTSGLVIRLSALGDVLDRRIRNIMLLGYSGLRHIVGMPGIPLLLGPMASIGSFRLAVQPQFRDGLMAWGALLEARVSLSDLIPVVDG
mmetsp:Transcript_13481/g.29120  ORF Transcript_13481/g.29120 Transcript_13481/m.29120 type:complete len:272 (-) Transcript_13481:609-1424(-)